ncbi:hypothetical protein MMC19_001604 [Ptychographa xylographoides]|nr:hypothetical protein [Ptychographa xylographoides]
MRFPKTLALLPAIIAFLLSPTLALYDVTSLYHGPTVFDPHYHTASIYEHGDLPTTYFKSTPLYIQRDAHPATFYKNKFYRYDAILDAEYLSAYGDVALRRRYQRHTDVRIVPRIPIPLKSRGERPAKGAHGNATPEENDRLKASLPAESQIQLTRLGVLKDAAHKAAGMAKKKEDFVTASQKV